MEELGGIKTVSGKHKSFLTQSRPTYVTHKRDVGELIVEPGELRFDDVEPGVLYVMTFSLRNNTKVAQRIRISPPNSGYFALNYIPSGAVAPGLDIRAEIECQLPMGTNELVFTDKVVVTMGSYRVEMPISACTPVPDIQFRRIIDSGDIVLHHPLTVDIPFENVGSIAGRVRLSSHADSCIRSIVPNRFDLEPEGQQVVRVTVEGREGGKWTELIKVHIEGTLAEALVELSANFIVPQLTLITTNSSGMLEQADFGNAFYGETKTIQGILVNACPLALNYAVAYEDEEEGEEVPQTDEAAYYARTLTISPADGLVKAFSQIAVTLTFRPTMLVPARGFARQHEDDNRAARAMTRKVAIDCSEAEQRLTITMAGQATAPDVCVLPSTLRFGECPVNDRRDILISVANRSKHTTSYEFPVIANFKFNPTKGVLLGMETVAVVASFLPPQLGKFKSAVKLSLAGGLGVFEVHCVGCSDNAGFRKRLAGGTDMLPDDFNKQLKFVNPEEEAEARLEQRRALQASEIQSQILLKTSLQAKLGATNYLALPRAPPPPSPVSHMPPIEGEEGDVLAGLGVPKEVIPSDLASSASSHERNFMYGLTDLSVAQPLEADHPMLERRANNRAYNDFLQQSHALRKETHRKQLLKRALRRGAPDFEDPYGVNMGMERGLDEPAIKLPPAGEPLWTANGASEGEGAVGRRIPADENRLIVKKYGSTPATQAELRDCSTELTQDDLKMVQGSHKLLDFGRVSVGSTSLKSFSVANDLNHSVVVRVEELEAELSQSKHLCQVVPQGCLAGFDICFSSRHIGKVKKVFQWKINNMHVSKVVVTAEVVPIELTMGVAELLMEFPFDSLDPTLSADLVLHNPGNAPADFLWGSAGAFLCSPETGSIGPGDSSVITVTWSPLSGKRNEEELGLHISGGVDQVLRVRGVLKETRAEFAEKRINLGTMAVGTEKIVTATVKNTGDNPLVYFLAPMDERLGIRATPEEELVLPGDSAVITLKVTPRAATSYDNVVLNVKVRGGRHISLKLGGSSIIPELRLFQERFDFGSVVVGGEQRLPLTIENKTPILTTLILDLTQHLDFTPYIRGAADEDEALAVHSVVGTVNAEQEDMQGNQVLLKAREDRTGKTKANMWNILIQPNSTLQADLVFRPAGPKHKAFQLPLFLQGITEDRSLNRDVSATSQTSAVSISSMVVDFGDRVVSRDPLSRISYFLETTLKNVTSKRAVTYVIREAVEVVREFGDVEPAPNPTMGEAKDKIFFVAPTKGDLGPGEDTPIRITFQPQSSANYSKKLELYIEGQPDPSRPYLTLLCQGSGVYPRLTFSQQAVSLPNVPLGVTSRACFTIFNNGYNSLDINHRISPNIPLPLDITYPDGQSVGIMVQQIRVVVAFKSDTPSSWAGKIEFFDQDGERFCVAVSGCADGCLLTNYPFVRDYASEYGFMGAEEAPVKYLKKGVIAEMRQVEARRKEEQRRLRSLERMRAVEGKKDDHSVVSKTSTRTSVGKVRPQDSVNSAESKEVDESEGVDYTKKPPLPYLESEPIFLLKWLNKNIARRPFDTDRYPHCVLDGDLVVECVELMCGKKIPGVKAADYSEKGQPPKAKKGSEKANKTGTTNRSVFKMQALLSFLIGNGALLGHVSPVSLLGLEEHLIAQELDLTRDKSQRFTPAMLADRRGGWETKWLGGCKAAWLEVLYQSVKVFVLARLNFKSFAAMPGVLLLGEETYGVTETKGEKGGKKKRAPLYPKDLSPSNVFTHAEAVLLRWASYHAEAASKLKDEGASSTEQLSNFPKRVTDLDLDFKHVVGFCQMVHSHVPDCTAAGSPLHGYSMLERNKGDDVYHILEDQLAQLHMELGASYEEMASSTRSLLLMLLHLYLHLPNLVPKTVVEFSGDLGTPIMKQIELRNPSRKAIEYSVSLTGSQDFSAQAGTLTIPPESSAQFLITLNAKFVEPVRAKLIFWSQKTGGLAGTTMSFKLVSRITGRRPTEVIHKDTRLYELEQFQVRVMSPFPRDTTYTVSLHVSASVLSLDEQMAKERGERVKRKALKAVETHLHQDLSVLSAVDRKNLEEEADVELCFRQPFWCSEDTVTASKAHPKSITVYFLPFLMGRYSCQVVFTERDSGEFCKELLADVGLPKPSDKLELKGFKDTPITLALRISSKNATFEKAYAALVDMRIKNNSKRMRARPIFQNLLSSRVADAESGVSQFQIDFLPQFFEYRKTMPFISEYMKLEEGGKAKFKKMLKTVLEPVTPDEFDASTLNTTMINFVPPRAGQYHSLAVVRSKDNAHDVRVIELSAAVVMPNSDMLLEFAGPARRKLLQQIPIHNVSLINWNLTVTVSGKGFSGPKSLQVGAGQTAAVEVGFAAPRAGHYAGTLLLRNSSEAGDTFEYKLIGEADEPLAEDDIHYEAIARTKKSLTIHLPQTRASGAGAGATNATAEMSPRKGKPKTYTVESDLPYAHFSEKVQLLPGESEFKFTLNAPMGGSLLGTFTFTDEDGTLIWYTVSVDVAAPKEEQEIAVTAQVRRAAAVDITLENPTDEPLLFSVQYHGDGLLGQDSILLPPSSTKNAGDGSAIYELIYSPLLAGKFLGRISFTNQLVGALWYKLNLTATPADPVRLPPIEGMLGSYGTARAPIENPSAEAVVFTVYAEDPHFTPPDKVSLAPYAQSHFPIHFTPTSLATGAFSRVILQNPKFGEVIYEVEGVPTLPGVMPAVHIDAPLAEIGSQTLVFQNPFPHPLPLEITLTHAEPPTDPKSQRNRHAILSNLRAMQAAFGLLSRKNAIVVPALSAHHIALSFSPEKMGTYEAVVEVRSEVAGLHLMWAYPLRGMAEAGVAQRLPHLRTACKTTLMREVNINLDGIISADMLAGEELQLSDFSVEVTTDDTVKSQVARAFRVQPLEIVRTAHSPQSSSPSLSPPRHGTSDFCLRCRLLFEPLRTFIAAAELVVVCRNRGKWRAKLDLDATEPEADDIIRLVAPVGGSDKVSFKLNNRFLGHSSFQAYYSAKSSQHFAVTPATGVLAPYGAEPTTFTVTFSPTEYGNKETGMLIVMTEDAEWCYEIRGSYPATTINMANVKSKIDNNR